MTSIKENHLEWDLKACHGTGVLIICVIPESEVSKKINSACRNRIWGFWDEEEGNISVV